MKRRGPDDTWERARRVVAAMPDGTWTTYGDLGKAIGAHPKTVGNYLTARTCPGAYRVLEHSHALAENAPEEAPGVPHPRSLLEASGVRFDDDGHADTSQRLSVTDLARLAGEP
jgi:alkylated DNA nucleotide flippase Atl1